MRRKQLSGKSELERFVAEQAVLFARELQRTCDAAPDGQVLDQAEGVILKQGWDFLRKALQASLQQQAEAAEKKGRRAGIVSAKVGAMTKGAAADGS
jgi:hypothetical protein